MLPRFEEVAVGFHGLFVLALLFPCSGDAVQREARVWTLFELFLIRFAGFFKPSGADQCAAQHLQRRTRILRGLGVSEFFFIFAGAFEELASLLKVAFSHFGIAAQFEGCCA